MSKQLEELSKDLASGVSRRKAFWRFGAGIGAIIAGFVFRRPARADDGVGEFCVDYCRSLNLEGKEFGQCVSECVNRITTNAA